MTKIVPKFSLQNVFCSRMMSDVNFKTCNPYIYAGLPWSGKNIWKINFFPGQGKIRKFC